MRHIRKIMNRESGRLGKVTIVGYFKALPPIFVWKDWR
jgi:hypothetical protein